MYYSSAIIACLAVFSFLFFCKDKNIFGSKLTNKQLVALIYGSLFFVRFLGGVPKIQSTIGLNQFSPFGVHGIPETFLSIVLLWLIFAVQLAEVTFPFFEKHVPCVGPVVKFGGTAVYALSLIFIPTLNRALNGDGFEEFHYRLLAFALEIGVGLALSVFSLFDLNQIKLSVKQHLTSVAIFLGMLVVAMPSWAPQAIFGHPYDFVVKDFTLAHRLFIYVIPLFGLALHFLFKGCEYDQKRYALIYISMATMINFSYRYDFSTFGKIYQWPLHLCNLALFILPIILIFKLDKLYYFTIFINVFGALIAMILPNLSDSTHWLSSISVEFWNTHYIAMLLPLLMMSLGIFERPKFKQFVYSLVGFFGYYLIVLIANAICTGIGHATDFFFINTDFVASKLGEWAEDLRDIVIKIPFKEYTFIFYPVYQLLYFIAYVLLSLAMWFVYEQVFEITDINDIITERNRKIKADRLALEAQLAGRSMQEPLNPQNEGKLILRDFSKRYSTSDVYAVYKANLEIDGGQIFGFLGPNGAGKSTIIKTIVGIQTITSGEIEVSGFDVNKQSVEAKMQIGFVPDHYALYENLSGREYINYIADLYNVSKEDRDVRISEYVERFRLEAAIDNPMKTYSHGMKQKITIMSALVHNPKIWILDEPLTGLDPESIFQVKECMKEHAARGNLVFFSSHIIDVVENICDRIAIIRKGQILCTKTVAEIKESGIPLEKFYMSMIDGNTQSPVTVKEAEAMESVQAGEMA